jgi:hypothetical protein
MLLSEITHKTTLKSITKHNITPDQLANIESIDALRLIIQRSSRRLWQGNHRDYFKAKYTNEYRDRVLTSAKERTKIMQFFRELPQV